MVKIMENPFKMDDLGVSLFLETPVCTYLPIHLPLKPPECRYKYLNKQKKIHSSPTNPKQLGFLFIAQICPFRKG